MFFINKQQIESYHEKYYGSFFKNESPYIIFMLINYRPLNTIVRNLVTE